MKTKMPGRSLSIGRCCVRNCKSHYLRNSDLVFSSIPKVGINLVNPTRIKITSQRRAAWLRALGLEHLNESSSLINRAVCSLHFQSGIFFLFKSVQIVAAVSFLFLPSVAIYQDWCNHNASFITILFRRRPSSCHFYF